jgi:HNH endonuclease
MTLWQKLIRMCVKTPSGCWRFQGALDQDGYALVRVGKQVRRGHQVMWEIHNGRRIPPGYQPDHTCILTSCINPYHL